MRCARCGVLVGVGDLYVEGDQHDASPDAVVGALDHRAVVGVEPKQVAGIEFPEVFSHSACLDPVAASEFLHLCFVRLR